jgi:hypothetical protein
MFTETEAPYEPLALRWVAMGRRPDQQPCGVVNTA